ncbi:hypothetical protein [Brachybacterium tyrofermentans]|uniref:hypothetical protein n=1 Tax=Brachybacterium tyrofermentans TaxID=47848 RepID=UPI003FCF51ED
MTIDDEVPQRVFGVVLPVAPLVRDLRIELEGEDDTIAVIVELTVGEDVERLALLKGIDAYEENAVLSLGWLSSDWSTLGRDIDVRFDLPAGSGAPISTLLSRVGEVAVVGARSKGILGVVELQEELRGVLESYATSPA